MSIFNLFHKTKKSVIQGNSLFNFEDGNAITSSAIALEKSIYVSSCLFENGKRISALEPSIKIKDTGLFTFDEVIFSIYAWLELEGYAIVWNDLGTLKVLDLAYVSNMDGTITYTKNQKQIDIPNKEIAYIHNFSPYLNSKGMPALTKAAFQIINTQNNQNTAVNTFYKQGMFAQAYMSTKQSLTTEQIKALHAHINSVLSGPKNAGRIPILHSGLGITTLSMSPDQFKQLASDNVTLEQIALVFGVPPMLLGRMESGWSNKAPIILNYINSTIIPKAKLIASQIDRFILPLMGIKGTFEFDTKNIPELQEAKLTMALAYKDLLTLKVVTINEVRQSIGLDPAPWGAVPMITAPVQTFSYEPKNELYEHHHINTKTIAQDSLRRVDTQAKKLRPKFKDLFKQMKKDVMKQVESIETPEDFKTLEIPGKYIDKLKSIGRQYFPGIYLEAGQSVVLAYGQKSITKEAVGVSFSLEDPYVQAMMEEQVIVLSQNVYTSSVDLLKEKVRGIIKQSRLEGLGITDTMKELNKGIKGEFDGWQDYRAERVARTESLKANTRGATEGARQNGMNAKAWLPSGAWNPRDEHAAMDPNNFIPLEAYFDVGGIMMYGPGDGPASEVVNCGCSLLYDWRE